MEPRSKWNTTLRYWQYFNRIATSQFYGVVSISHQCVSRTQTGQIPEQSVLLESWAIQQLSAIGICFCSTPHAFCSNDQYCLKAYDFFLLFADLLISELCPQQQQQGPMWRALHQEFWMPFGAHNNHSVHKQARVYTDEKLETRKFERLPLKSHRQVMQTGFKPRRVCL